MAVKAADLFEAFGEGRLPAEGWAAWAAFHPATGCALYEIVAYRGASLARRGDDGLSFTAEGERVYALAEPAGYPRAALEPSERPRGEALPLRLAEADLFQAEDGSRVYVSKAAAPIGGSFAVPRPAGADFAFVFHHRPDIALTLRLFFEKTLRLEAGIPLECARRAAEAVARAAAPGAA